MRKKDVLGGDKPHLTDNSVLTFIELKKKEYLFCKDNKITLQGFEVLVLVYDHWYRFGIPCTMWYIINKFSGSSGDGYKNLHNKLTTLSNNGFVDGYKSFEGRLTFAPTAKAIEGINSLLSVIN